MKDKHTKGRWRILKDVKGDYIISAKESTYDNICEIDWTSDDAEANAQLIAQAPTLLEQNRELKEALKIMTSLTRTKYGNLDKDVYAEIEKAEALLNKYK